MSTSDDEIDILGDTPPSSVYSSQPKATSWLLDTSTVPSSCDNNEQDYGAILDFTNNCLVEEEDQQASTSGALLNKWSDSEIQSLGEAIKLYNYDLHKISNFIKSRSHAEVRAFLKSKFEHHAESSKYFNCDLPKSDVFDKSELLSDSDIPASIEEVISMVSTGDTTLSKKRLKSHDNSAHSKNSFAKESNAPQAADALGSKTIYNLKEDPCNEDEAVIRNILRSNIPTLGKSSLKSTLKNRNVGQSKYTENNLNIFLASHKKRKENLNNKQKTKNLLKNLRRKFSNPKQTKMDIAPMQIVMGSGQVLPLSEGEQVIKIKKDPQSDIESDIEIDIDDDTEFANEKTIDTNLPRTQSMVKPAILKSVPNIPNDISFYLKSTLTPDEEWTVIDDEISKIEIILNSDHFKERDKKTFDNYKYVRSQIINAWKKTKPKYLSKDSIEIDLKSFNEVLSVDKIFFVLEQIGAINFGCQETSYIRPLMSLLESDNLEKISSRQRRKKLILNGDGGYTITHTEYGEFCEAVSEPKHHRPRKQPINLMLCKSFSDRNPAPYSVHVSLSSLILMDVHSYTSRAEVMGLLGGQFLTNQNSLYVKKYIPCDSLENSGTHCDMCPVSQSKASDMFTQENLETIGWYHSHPLFPPQPSAQDILSQTDLQMAFSPHPFIAIIISPFWLPGRTLSQYNCFITQKDVDLKDENAAYKLKTNLYCDLNDESEVRRILSDVENIYNKQKCSGSSYVINLETDVCASTNILYSEKCISSITHHLKACKPLINEKICEDVLNGLINIFKK